jgi:predicted NUDIX family NTP pyrophosphohydrolase
MARAQQGDRLAAAGLKRSRKSAGLLMFRRRALVEVLLVHPGGPFWAGKDAGAWSIPKGEYGDEEHPLEGARREFAEETGFAASPPFLALGTLKQPNGKLVTAWAFEGDCDPARLTSNTFEMEWPPRSGRMATFPEVDRACWFELTQARQHILRGQAAFIDALVTALAASSA